jgi:hypothetical protein
MPYPRQAEDLTEDWIKETLMKNIPDLAEVKMVSMDIENENEKSGTLRLIHLINFSLFIVLNLTLLFGYKIASLLLFNNFRSAHLITKGPQSH